jgi:hypothetical protein
MRGIGQGPGKIFHSLLSMVQTCLKFEPRPSSTSSECLLASPEIECLYESGILRIKALALRCVHRIEL